MDLSKLSTADLEAIANGDMSRVSTEGLTLIAGQDPTPAIPQNGAPVKTAQTSVSEDLLRGFRDPVDAAAQLLPRALAAITSAGGIIPNEVSQWFEKESKRVDELNKIAEAEYRAKGGEDISVGRVVGNILSPASVVPATRVAGLVGRGLGAGRLAQGAAVGATGGALTPVQDAEDFAGVKATQIGLGAGLGAALEKAGGIIKPRVLPEAQRLRAAGIETLTPGQMSGGVAQKLEQAAESVPLVGDVIAGARQKNIEQFGSAVINEALQKIDKKLPKGLVGNRAIQFAQDTLSKEYDKIVPKLSLSINTPLPAGDAVVSLGDDIADIVRFASQEVDAAKADQLQKIVQARILDKFKDGVIKGDDLKSLESSIGNFARRFKKSPDPDQNRLGDAFFDIQLSLREALAVNNPMYANQLQNVNSAFADFVRIQKAASSLGAKEGVFTPAQLRSAIRSEDITARKGAFAKGEARMQDIAEAGERVLGSKLPDSGTPYRLATGAGALGALSSLEPTSLALSLGGIGAYTEPGLRTLQALLYKRPESVYGVPLSNVRSAVPYLTPGLLGPFQE